jgi:uncharacterized protein (TIGR03086 family)
MTNALDHWKTAGLLFASKLGELGDDDWVASTNCGSWNVREMVEHAVDYQRMYGRFLGAGPGVETELGDDPAAAWTEIRDALIAIYESPGTLERSFDFLPFGELVADQIAAPITDLVIHTWDIARATATDESLPDDICAFVLDGLRSVEEIIRGPGLYEAAIDPPPGASIATQMLCYAGRTA